MPKVALPFGTKTPEDKRGKYRAALLAAGIEPVEDAQSLEGLDGLMLAGGTDIDPALYRQSRDPGTDEPDEVRDRLERDLLFEALRRDLPVLGICRGLQFVNVALGGALIQHIEHHKCPKQREVHPVRIAAGSRLASILGTTEYIVNSRHHQCAGSIAPGVVVTATAPDGVVEALEIPGKRFALAVQWHPEARADGEDRKIFDAFAAALSARGDSSSRAGS